MTASAPGSYLNAIPAGALTTTQGATNSNATNATLTVTAAPPVTISKASPTHSSPHGVSRLTIALNNSASGAVSLTGVALTDALPAGVTIAATPDAATTCASGTVRAIAGGPSVALIGEFVRGHGVHDRGERDGRDAGSIRQHDSGRSADQRARRDERLAGVGDADGRQRGRRHVDQGVFDNITPNGRVGLTITLANLDPDSVPLTGSS